MSQAKMMETLFRAVDLHKLTDEQLDDLQCHEEIKGHLNDIATMLNGIGCLVASDTDVGNFQDTTDVPALTFGVATMLEMMAVSVSISTDAAFVKAQRATRKAEVEEFRKQVAAASA